MSEYLLNTAEKSMFHEIVRKYLIEYDFHKVVFTNKRVEFRSAGALDKAYKFTDFQATPDELKEIVDNVQRNIPYAQSEYLFY